MDLKTAQMDRTAINPIRSLSVQEEMEVTHPKSPLSYCLCDKQYRVMMNKQLTGAPLTKSCDVWSVHDWLMPSFAVQKFSKNIPHSGRRKKR